MLHPGTSCRGESPRDSCVHSLSRRDGNPLGAWSSIERQARPVEVLPVMKALLPAEVASLIVWIAASPAELVLNEVIITALEEQGWP
jgi:hypothetical protein